MKNNLLRSKLYRWTRFYLRSSCGLWSWRILSRCGPPVRFSCLAARPPRLTR